MATAAVFGTGDSGSAVVRRPAGRAGIRVAASARLRVPIERVDLELLAHHYHVAYFWQRLEEHEPLARDTWHLRVLVDGEDRSGELDLADLLAEAGRDIPSGRAVAE